jgi:hypothetical protein
MSALRKVFFALVLALAFPAVLAAQEKTQQDLLRFYDAELFQWNFSVFGGLTLNFQNQSALPAYGIKAPMKEAFLRYPDSAKEYKSYRWKNLMGNILMWGGLAVSIGVLYSPMFMDRKHQDAYDVYDEDDIRYANILVSTALGGLVCNMIGIFLISGGQENLYDAVNTYNRARVGDF